MKLKNDWSFAHFIYYLSWLFLASIFMNFLIITGNYYTAGTDVYLSMPGTDPMVKVDPHQFTDKEFQLNGKNYLFPESVHLRAMLWSNTDSIINGNLQMLGIRFLRSLTLFCFFFFLMKILRTVVDKNPFEPKNSKRLYYMGLLLLALTGIKIFHSIFTAHFFNNQVYEPDIEFFPAIEIEFLPFFGLVLLLLGYVFKEGTRIYEEQKLTV